jgi:hypothetical protein
VICEYFLLLNGFFFSLTKSFFWPHLIPGNSVSSIQFKATPTDLVSLSFLKLDLGLVILPFFKGRQSNSPFLLPYTSFSLRISKIGESICCKALGSFRKCELRVQLRGQEPKGSKSLWFVIYNLVKLLFGKELQTFGPKILSEGWSLLFPFQALILNTIIIKCLQHFFS